VSAVQQEQGSAFAVDLVIHAKAVDRGISRLDRGLLIGRCHLVVPFWFGRIARQAQGQRADAGAAAGGAECVHWTDSACRAGEAPRKVGCSSARVPAPGCGGCAGIKMAARTAPTRATAAATRQATAKPSKNAFEAALWSVLASIGRWVALSGRRSGMRRPLICVPRLRQRAAAFRRSQNRAGCHT